MIEIKKKYIYAILSGCPKLNDCSTLGCQHFRTLYFLQIVPTHYLVIITD